LELLCDAPWGGFDTLMELGVTRLSPCRCWHWFAMGQTSARVVDRPDRLDLSTR
jgi:hypothetical protein